MSNVAVLQFDRQAKTALVVCIATMLVSGLGFQAVMKRWGITLKKEPVALREPLTDIPRRLGEWESLSKDKALSKEMEEELGTSHYMTRQYTRKDPVTGEKIALDVHLTYYTGMIDAVPHVPDRCLLAAGWDNLSALPSNLPLPVRTDHWGLDEAAISARTGQPYPTMTIRHYITGRPLKVHMPLGELELRTSQYQMKTRPKVHLFAGYLFLANGQTTPHPWGVQAKAFDKIDRHAYYCKLQFATLVEADKADQDKFVERVADLLESLLPEVMRCLPDWAEVEKSTSQQINKSTLKSQQVNKSTSQQVNSQASSGEAAALLILIC